VLWLHRVAAGCGPTTAATTATTATTATAATTAATAATAATTAANACAAQRATIVVHDDKVLVKTEIVKAIITPDKAVLIKGRCVRAQRGCALRHGRRRRTGRAWLVCWRACACCVCWPT
jgi:hypothetical protein